MAHRVNYIIKENEKFNFYFDGAGGRFLTKNLLKGPDVVERNIKYFSEWGTMRYADEGCIFLDIDRKILRFWSFPDLSYQSVANRYLELLKEKWKGWKVAETCDYYIRKIVRYYGNDVELDDEVKQKEITIDDIEQKPRRDYSHPLGLIILNYNGKHRVKTFIDYNEERMMHLGEKLVDFLVQRRNGSLPHERNIEPCLGVYIDDDNKIIRSAYKFEKNRDEIKEAWKGWKIHDNNIGYLKLIEMLGYDPEKYKMTKEEVEEEIHDMTNFEEEHFV